MCEINNIGYIYKITNLVNNKIYIGQTSKPIKKRWDRHKIDAFREDRNCYNYPLYKAIRKYGVNNFKIEEIEKCEINKLNEREIYYVSFYDSFNNKKGYNQTLGGDGFKLLNLDEKKVINKYQELGVVYKVADFFHCSSHSIRNILNKHEVEIISSEQLAKEKGKIIKRFSLDGEFLEEYKTLREAGRWVVKEGLSSCNNDYSESLKIRRCIEHQESYLNFLWDSESYSKKKIEKQKIHKKEANVDKKKILKNHLPEIPKQTLMKLVREKSFIEIGKMYNVSDNAIKKWCIKYLIPYRKKDINNIFDEEWTKECNLSKEEYEVKYGINKENETFSDIEIINYYIETNSLKKVTEKFHKDISTIRNILNKNDIELINNKTLLRCNKDTEEVIYVYKSMKELLLWNSKNNENVNEIEFLQSISKAVNSVHNAYGYKWKRA